MVYDYIQCKECNLDFEELADVIRANAQLICHSRRELSFFNDWIGLLRRAYDSNSCELFTQNLDDSQLFQKEIFLGNQKILLHFQVNVLNNLLEKYCAPQKYYIDDLLNGGLMFTPETGDFITPLENPILIVPFPLDPYNAFVVDGNHRLSYKIAHNAKKIIAYNIDPNIAVVSLINTFEKYIYGIIMDSFIVKNNPRDVIFELPSSFYRHFNYQLQNHQPQE